MEFDMGSYFPEPPILYFVPDGTDSLVVVVSHQLSMSATEGYTNVSFRVYSTTFGTVYVYNETVCYYESFNDSSPIEYVMVDPPTGTFIGFHFHAQVEDEYYGEVDWRIYGLVATAFGDTLGLVPETWGGIKVTSR
jgi:hypothetical protein